MEILFYKLQTFETYKSIKLLGKPLHLFIVQFLFPDTLDQAIEEAKWKDEHYPHLCAPYSPCVILQWTYRDGI